jgi:hypothetical protein
MLSFTRFPSGLGPHNPKSLKSLELPWCMARPRGGVGVPRSVSEYTSCGRAQHFPAFLAGAGQFVVPSITMADLVAQDDIVVPASLPQLLVGHDPDRAFARGPRPEGEPREAARVHCVAATRSPADWVAGTSKNASVADLHGDASN